MFVIGVPASDWITYQEQKFSRPLTTKDSWKVSKEQESKCLFDSSGRPILVEDRVGYFSFQNKNYLRYLEYLGKYDLGIKTEETTLWDYLKTKGLIVASNLQFNDRIDQRDLIGIKVSSKDEYNSRRFFRSQLEEEFEKAKKALAEVGVDGELQLASDLKWAAD